MATTNPFDLLGDDEYDDPSQLIAAQQQKLAMAPKKTPVPAQQPTKQPAKLPSKPLPPAQAVRETKTEVQRGGGRGRGRGGRGFERDSADNDNTFVSSNGFSGGYRPLEDRDGGKPSERHGNGGPRGGFRGGRRGGFNNGEVVEGERTRRIYDRRSGTGRGNEFKRDGAGRGNWGTPTDEIAPESEEREPVNESEKIVDAEKQSSQEDVGDAKKDNPLNEPEEKEPEDKEMTLEEYQKVLEEKRKALLALKTEERKVHLDKEFESMQLLSSKKNDDEIFVKLGSEKDKRKEAAEKEEKAKKAVNINEFLKPAEGQNYSRPGGRGRGRGRGRGGYSGNDVRSNVEAPAIEDAGQFPTLGAK
ncbi:unnamed protein product [Ilex paraguariensis]|uniref:Hyaluronan/mRNA-binding protein domain-containing protein n=1 Tax=Ilex paraguariensis TaxID=185542 RepID=A0ABC8TZP0_9AQUA